jgi:hypothetical protein
MRPALIFRRNAASGIRRLFLGFLPTAVVPLAPHDPASPIP